MTDEVFLDKKRAHPSSDAPVAFEVLPTKNSPEGKPESQGGPTNPFHLDTTLYESDLKVNNIATVSPK
jgi:hypothetical protein